ncbi:hypothetical protein [uncultured Oscillibacter sp.]|uniref:hypothetical protein n=1 Tax=uncultured Oscillibacter sp. TaxID=876091 RepID=UPI002611F501|nr:hypothetical protein [uncultured Oscillibacter sp.]
MKTLKRELGTEKKLSDIKKEYDEVVNKIEARDDADFFFTIAHLCKQYNLNLFSGKEKRDRNGTLPLPPSDRGDIEVVKSEIRGYISEVHPYTTWIGIVLLHVWHFLLYLAPVLIFIFCSCSNLPRFSRLQ